LTELLATLAAFGALVCAFQFGVWFVTDKARHVLALEAFFRACYDVTVRRKIRQWMREDIGEAPYRSVARADRVEMRTVAE